MMSDYTWVDSHAAEITEFSLDPWENDACGPTASEVCRACIDGRAPTIARMLAIREHDLAAGLFGVGRGQTVQDLVQATPAPYHVTLYPDPVNYATPDHAALASVLVAALRDRHNPCVLNVGNAEALQGNEHGVAWHFVAGVGIRSVGGVVSVLIANGDEIPFRGRPRWVPLTNLTAADLVAIVEFHRPQGVPTMQVPQGWHFDGVTLTPGAPSPIDRAVHAVAHELNPFVLTWPGGWAADNIPLEATQDDETANGVVTRFHQTFAYLQVRATRADAHSPWQPFLGNIGVDLLDAAATIANLHDQLTHPVKNPAPAPSPDENAALKAALIDIVNRAQAALN